MSISNLNKIKKDLLQIKKNSNNEKCIIQALDGLFLVDFKADIDKREKRIKPINEVPSDMKVNTVGANIDDIIICGGMGEPMIIVDDIEDIEIPDIKTLNVKSVSSREEALASIEIRNNSKSWN